MDSKEEEDVKQAIDNAGDIINLQVKFSVLLFWRINYGINCSNSQKSF